VDRGIKTFVIFAWLLTRGSFPWRELGLMAGHAAGEATLLPDVHAPGLLAQHFPQSAA